jgi:putative ABC transport system permease protein
MINKIIKFTKVGFASARENLGRTLLTMLGIIIGVGSVILMTSLGLGAESYILGSVSSFGPDLIYIQPGSPDDGFTGAIVAPDRLKYRDFLAMKNVDFLKDVTPFQAYDAIITYQNKNEKTQVLGANKNYTTAVNYFPMSGRFIDDNDVNTAARITVLGKKIAGRLFEGQNPIGEQIKIKNINFTVVGIMEEQGGNAFENYDDMIFIPITAMQSYLFNVDYIMTIAARAVGPVDEAIAKSQDFVRKLHRIDNPEGLPAKDDFNVMSQGQALDIFKTVSNVLTYFIVAIAAISLIVGGVGIMNTMYVSVNQRTREIGLRKAVGATSFDVLLQFLIEAILLTVIGGIIGIILGIFLAFLIYLGVSQLLPSWSFGVNWNAVIVSTAVSVIIGLVFGIYPAKKAASKDPIESLRYE